MTNTEKVIAAFKSEVDLDVTPEQELETLDMDSLEFVNLMVVLDVPDEKQPGLVTVGDIIEALA
jgi:acyl carrier protein